MEPCLCWPTTTVHGIYFLPKWRGGDVLVNGSYTKNLRHLENGWIGGNNLFMGKITQLATQYQMVSHENILKINL